MASIQRLRELTAELRNIQGAGEESQRAIQKLARELTILVERAEGLSFGGIGGSQAELDATERNLNEIIQAFKELDVTGRGAFDNIVQEIRAVVVNLDILNAKQRDVYANFTKFAHPGTTLTPGAERYGLAQPKQEHLFQVAEAARNATTETTEATLAMRLLADTVDLVAQRMTRTKGRMAIAPATEELRNLEAALRYVENLGANEPQLRQVAMAIREILGTMPAAPTKRDLLDQMGFRETGTANLQDIILKLRQVQEAELGIAAGAEQAGQAIQQMTMQLQDPRATGQLGLWGGTFAPERWTGVTKGIPYGGREEVEAADFGRMIPLGEQLATSPLLQLVSSGQLDTGFRIISGNVEQLGRVLRDNDQLMKAVTVGVEALRKSYDAAGLEAQEFTVAIDAANKAIQVQATQMEAPVRTPSSLKQTQEAVAAVTQIQESVRVGLGDARIINQTEELQKAFTRLGASATGVKNLETALKGFGLTINDIRGASYDANEGLIRFSASADAGAGIMRQASVILNQNGEVVETVKRKYEGLGGAIVNNINKVIRWGVAVGVVYGSINRLRAAIDEMIGLETAFADITIITGKSVEELGTAFDSIVEAAQKTGISLSEATAAFEKALRAAGRTADEAERVAKAQVLMADALVLSRLANVDQAQAIDMLTGALRQMGLDINQGTVLLDKWVATNRAAFVGLETLAESFAITASQADAVGVKIDQLNGIIATIAEATTLSATEVGNFARTLLSALESDQAITTLQQYGIAIKDVTGGLRDWGEVMQDIYDFWRAGAISDRELSQIGRVLGGGARRGPQFVAFLKEYGRVNEIAAQSANASGDAAEALDIKMDTLRNTINSLSVAFSTLASSLGQEGGLLDFMTNIVKFTTGAIDVLSDLTSILGDTTTQIIALTVAYTTLSKAGIFQRIGGAIRGGGGIGAAAGAAAAAGPVQLGLPRFGTGPQAADFAKVGTSVGDRAVAAMRAAAPTIGTGIGIGALTYMTTGSLVQGAGAGIGGAIGSVLGGPVGMLAGSAIGNIIGSMIEDSFRRSADLSDVLDVTARGDELSMDQTIQGLTTILDDWRTQVNRWQDKGPEIQIGDESRQLIENWSIARPEDIVEAARILRQSLQETIDINLERDVNRAHTESLQRNVSAIDKLIEQYDLHRKAVEENTAALKEEVPPSAYALELAGARQQFGPGIQQELEVGRAQRIQQFAAGEIPRAAYTRFLQVSEMLPQTISQVMVLLENEMKAAFGEGQDAANAMTRALEDMDPAAIEFIQERLAALQSVRADIDALGTSIGNTSIEMQYAVALQQQYSELAVQTSEEIVALIRNASAAAREPIRPAFTRYDDLTQGEFNQIYQQAIANQREYAEFIGVTSEEIAADAEDWIYVVENNLGQISGLWKLFFDDAFQKFKEARDQMQQEEFHVRRLQDVDPSRIGEIQARNRYWIEYLSRLQGISSEQYLAEEGYQENLILGPNNIWQKILTTNEAMSFTLQDILETEKKQLEGMWNIPEGATFWVPLTSLFYQDKGGAPGYPQLPPIDESLVEDLKEAAEGITPAVIEGEARPREVFMSKEEAMKMLGITLPEEEALGTGERPVEELENLNTVVDFLRKKAIETEMKPTEFFKRIIAVTDIGRKAGGDEESVIQRLFYKSYSDLVSELRPLMPDPTTDQEIADYLLEASQSLIEGIERISPGGTDAEPVTEHMLKIGDAATRALDTITTYFGAPLELNAQFQIESEKALMIQNIVTLDGSVIKAYVSEILAQETAKSAKATGFSATLMS